MWISGGEDARVKLCFLVMDCASRRPQSWRSAGNQCSHHGGRDRVSVWGVESKILRKDDREKR